MVRKFKASTTLLPLGIFKNTGTMVENVEFVKHFHILFI